jgi:hypothetical protein
MCEAKLDFYTFTTTPIGLFSQGSYLASSTGFVYKRSDKYYLISNWHVFSGRNAHSGKATHTSLAVPDEFSVVFHKDDFSGIRLGNRLRIVQEPVANWFQHPLGQSVDVACLQIHQAPQGTSIYPVNEGEIADELTHDVGQDCFILGYPFRAAQFELEKDATNFFPIWKRGSIATEYDVPFRGKDCFLVDVSTSAGMSGSPVFLRQYGFVRYRSGEIAMIRGAATQFVGVYSGRHQNTKDDILQLGYVWKRKLIDEMIEARCPGSYLMPE